jgi:hypothetical protein
MASRGVLRIAIVAAAALLAATPAATAETPAAQLCLGDAAVATPAALSRPAELESGAAWEAAAFRGLSCSRCNPATQYCVLNPVRYEYACAPLGTVACVSASRTHWCPASRGCWAGRCR